MSTYNRASLITNSIASVLSQTYTNFELIIWDDGSTDETDLIIRSFSDNRIRFFKDINHGKSWALNQCIGLANGDFIAIIDDDDVWMDTKLEQQITKMVKHQEFDVLFTNFNNLNLFTGEKGVGFDQNRKGIDELETEKVEEDLFLIKRNFQKALSISNFILPSSTLIRKRVFESTGLFEESLRNGEDFEFWWRASLLGISFGYTNQVLVNRTKPKGSLSSLSVLSSQNLIKCFELCQFDATSSFQNHYAIFLKKCFRNAYLALIREYAKTGERKKAFEAYLKSINYGISFRGIIYMFGALAGPKILNILRRR